MTTLQQRRVTIPPHRRKAQVTQTVWGVLAAVAGLFLVRYFALTPATPWNIAAVLLGARIASREFLIDCLRIARDILTLKRPNGQSPEPDARTDNEQ